MSSKHQLIRDKEVLFMEGADKVTQQIESHLKAFGERCETGRSHYEAAMLLREHEQLETGAFRTYATASQLLKTAEQLVKSGNVDREKVRETTKKLDGLWQGLTMKLNTHKEALSYSVTFYQKLEQVTAWLANWHYTIEQHQSKLASQELMSQLHRQSEVLTELFKGLQVDGRHLIKLLSSNKQYSESCSFVNSQLNIITTQYNNCFSLWSIYKSVHTTSSKVKRIEQQCQKIKTYLRVLEEESIIPFYDITTSLEIIKGRVVKLQELDDRLDPVLAEIDIMKSTANDLLNEGNENALSIVADINNYWAIFKLKKQQCEQYLRFTTHLYTQIRDVECNIRTLRQIIKSHKMNGSKDQTYNDFHSLKSSVLQQSSEICKQGSTMLELICLMTDTCHPSTLERPSKHIQTVIDKFKGADAVVRELRLQKVEKKRGGIENWINSIGEQFIKDHTDIGCSLEDTEKYSAQFIAFIDEVTGVKEKVDSIQDPVLDTAWSNFTNKLHSKHQQILLAKQFFLRVDEYHKRFKVSQEALAIDQLPDDVAGTDNLLVQCKAEPRHLNTIHESVTEVFGRLMKTIGSQSDSVLQTRGLQIKEIMAKLTDLHSDIKRSWLDREQKLSKGLELRKFEEGIKSTYLWISNNGDNFVKNYNYLPTTRAELAFVSEKFVEFERQIEREKVRLKELEESCSCLKDCIIFDNGAIDTRMLAARNAWNIFAEKFKTRRFLLATMMSDIVPLLDRMRDQLKQLRADSQKSNSDKNLIIIHLKKLHSQITEERRQIPQKIKSKIQPHIPSESHYLDKFVRHIQDDIDILINESKEIDSILSRTTSINSLNSVISSGSASSEGKMSVTSDEDKSRQPQAKLSGMPTGKPPIHNYKQQDSNLNRVRLAGNSCRPESFNSDSGIIASSGSSDSGQSRWSWPEDSKGSENKPPTISEISTPQKEDASKKLSLVVEELIKSEHDFVLGLRFIVKDYTPELMKSKFWNLSEKLLGNISDIYRFHGELFLPDLLQCNGDPINVATVFLKHKDRYDMHVIYCRNKTISEVVYSEHEAEFEEIQKTLTPSLSLSAYLIKPVQRITKYQLLLTEMHKFAKQCNLVNLNKIELAQNVMLEVPRRANNLMHLEMLDNPPEDALVFQDSLSVTSGNAWISNQGKTRQVFLFKNFLVLAKHEVESKKLQYYSRKSVIELASCILHSESDTNRFSVSTGSVKYWFSAPTPALKAEWVRLISECVDYCTKAKCEDHLSIDSTEENRKGIQKIRSSLRFKRRKSLTKLNLKDEEIAKEMDNNDWCQPYITNNNSSLNNTSNTDNNKCLSKLSNISMSIDYINLINDSNTPEQTQPIKSGYKFVDILFYGHFSLFATCEHHRTGLQFTAQIVPIVDRQFYRSIQREVQILKVLNCKRLSRLHEILLEYENYVILVFSYQHQFKLLDYLLLKEVHREADSVEIMKQILEGISYLHNRNIAHLDLKPDNVIWDKTTIKIINYELAHYVDEENVFLEPTMLDEEFAAPELLMSRVATTASDIWSVGVITYLLLYSDSPFYIQHQIIPPNMRSFQYSSKGSSIFGESTLLFLSSLLQNDLRRRPDTQACLSSAWIKSSNMRLSGATLDKNRLRKFQERRRRSRKSPRFNIPDSLYQELGIGSDML